MDGASRASPAGDDPDRLQQVVGGGVLEEEPAGAGPECLVDVLVEVEGGQDEHARGAGPGGDPAGGLDAVEIRHADVHQHDLRTQPPRRLDHFFAVTRLSDHLQVRFGVQDDPEPGADKFLVVGDQDADGHGWAPFAPVSGRRARTR